MEECLGGVVFSQIVNVHHPCIAIMKCKLTIHDKLK